MRRLVDAPKPLLSFFFCQSTIPALNNALSVLRGLVYMLVTRKEDLFQYVYKRYKTAGRQLFEGLNALREILLDALNDASLPPTYLLIDALEECSFGMSELLKIITNAGIRRRSWSKC